MSHHQHIFFLEPGLHNKHEAFIASHSCTFRSLLNKIALLFILTFIVIIGNTYKTFAQKSNVDTKKGNDAYQKNDFQAAIDNYKKAVAEDPKNSVAQFNLGNALQQGNAPEDALKAYDEAIENTESAELRSQAYYNKALALIKQKKLAEAIDALKQSLRIRSEDDEARDNLQKALNELKKQQQQQQPQNNNQPQKKPQQQKDKPKQNKMSQQMMEQKFKELQNQEKQLQKQLQQKNNSVSQQEKDW